MADQPRSYRAWDDRRYNWPPPEGWHRSDDGKWYPPGEDRPEPPTGVPTRLMLAWATVAVCVVGAAAVSAIFGDDGELTAAERAELWRDLERSYDNMGCEADSSIDSVTLYYEGEATCELVLLATVSALDIPWVGPEGASPGTFRGDEFVMTVALPSDRIGTTVYVFRRR